MKAAAQVGLLVVVAVALFIGAVVFVGKALIPAKTDVYVVVMPDAGGLAKGARVLMAGVQVGEVTDVAVDTPTQAKLKIGLKKGTELPLSTRALIAGSLVGLGDTPLSLVQDAKYRGPQGEYTPGMTIQGGKAGPLDAILPDGGTTLYTQLGTTLKNFNAILADPSYKKSVGNLLATTDQTLKTSQNTLQAFAKLAGQGNALLGANQAQITAILRTAEGTLASVQKTALSVEKFAQSGKLQGDVQGLVADAHRIAVESQATLADLHRTLNDPKINGDLRAAADNLRATSDRLPALTDNANKVAANVADLTAKSQDLPKKLGDVLDNANELTKKLGGLSDKVGGAFGNKPKGLPPISAELDLIHETGPGHYRTDLNASVPLSEGFLTVGLFDAFENNRVNLQLGKRVNSSLDYRYGIYAARPGVGVDYDLTTKFGLRGDLWDINDPRFDARLRYDFGNGLIGWLGADRIFHGTGLEIGVGVRK